jgi:hypothetical protein|tara:strand:+ start:153 stop:383 length:231 start_codon:yes stop_codon:yes gene_type:complete
MTPREKKKMKQLIAANPVLMTEDTCVKAIFQYTLKAVVDDLHSDLSREERIEIYSETLLEVEELMNEINKGQRTLN